MGSFDLTNEQELSAEVDHVVDDIETRIFNALNYAGIQFQSNARSTKTYTDRTGNLTASIGYIVAKDGELISSKFDNDDGGFMGESLAMQVLLEYPLGYVLICVAGMKYGIYVEQVHGLSVISQAKDQTLELVKRMEKQILGNENTN